jgi:hypothetical protein
VSRTATPVTTIAHTATNAPIVTARYWDGCSRMTPPGYDR